MRGCRAIPCLAVLVSATAASGGAAAQGSTRGPAAIAAEAPRIRARASLDRTALWVGDRITYTVELTCAPGVGVLVDDLDRARLRLRGLEIVSADVEEANGPEGASIQRFRYTLTTFEPAPATLGIDELTVRFYEKRAGQRAEDVVPAGELRIPPSVIPLRSTLPDDVKAAAIRDARGHVPMPRWWPWVRPAGIGLIVVSMVPVAVFAGSALRRVRLPISRRRAWQARRLARNAMADLRSADVETEPARRGAYARLDRLVRDHLGRTLAMPVDALSPAEVAAAVRARRAALPSDVVASLLEDCELASYCPPGQVPSGDEFLKALAAGEAIVGRR